MIVDRGKTYQRARNSKTVEAATAETAVRSRRPASDNPALRPLAVLSAYRTCGWMQRVTWLGGDALLLP
jgi:hypothetical protein